MNKELDAVMKVLNEKRAQVKAIDDLLAKLTAELKEIEARSKKLKEDIEESEMMLYRAEKMIEGLAGEKERWTETVVSLTSSIEKVVGDSLVASGAISYSGSFTSVYRNELEETWRRAIKG